MLIFCAAAALIFLVLALANLRRGFYLYLASLPLLPAYIAIPLVQGGAGISLIRLMTYGLALALLANVVQTAKNWRPVFRRIAAWPALLLWGGCLYLAKFVSTASDQEAVALVYWLDEFVGVSIVFLLAARYVTTLEELRRLLLWLLPVVFVEQAIVFVEAAMEHPILQGIVDINVSTVGEKLAEGFERAGSYRTVGTFDNPLSLAEYLLIGAAMMIGAHLLSRRRNRLVLFCGLALTFVSLLLTGARFGYIAFSMGLLVTMAFYYGYQIRSIGRPVFFGLCASALAGIGYFAYLSITDVYWFLDISQSYLGGDDSGSSSIISRASQYLALPDAIFNNASSGFFGEGLRSDLIERLDLRLDSYYLRVLIEGGGFGLLSFVALVVLCIMRASRPVNYRHLEIRYAAGVRFFLILFFTIFAIDKFFLSMSYNNQYFFLFAGTAVALLGRQVLARISGGRLAHSSCP